MTRDDFEAAYAARSGVTVADLREMGMAARLNRLLHDRNVTRCQQCGAEALPSPTHALDLEAERDEALAAADIVRQSNAEMLREIDRLTADCTAALREIEALPRYDASGILYSDGSLVKREAVLQCLRSSSSPEMPPHQEKP